MQNIRDYIILGAGPAGIQLAYDMEKSGDDYLIIERGESAGSFFKEFPRHRTLISINKVYTGYTDHEVNMRWDWNSLLIDDDELLYKKVTEDYFPHADTMLDYLSNVVQKCQLKVKYQTEIVNIDQQENQIFVATDSSGKEYHARNIVVATGVSKPFSPDFPGAELTENYYDYEIDPKSFTGQRVLIIGKGNSAFETADSLIGTTSYIHMASPESLNFAWKTKYVGHLRAVNNNFLDTYQLKSQNVVMDAEISGICRNSDNSFRVAFDYKHAGGETEHLDYDRVISCTGFKFDDSIFSEKTKPKLTIKDRFPDQTIEWESSNIPGLYFAGTIMQARDFKKSQSGFVHGFRYNVRFLKKILDEKVKGIRIPHEAIEKKAKLLTDKIIERVNHSSALWQQSGYFCDLLTLQNGSFNYYEDLTKDYALSSSSLKSEQMFIVTLEFNKDVINSQKDVFALVRPNKNDPDSAANSIAIHPIVCEYSNGELVSTFQIIEDILGEWKEDVHIDPLNRYLSGRLQPQTCKIDEVTTA